MKRPGGYLLALWQLAMRVDAADFPFTAARFASASQYLINHSEVRELARRYQVPIRDVAQDLIRRGPSLTACWARSA